MLNIPKDLNTNTVKSQGASHHRNHNTFISFKEAYDCTLPQKIILGWSNLIIVKQFNFTLHKSYRLVSSAIIVVSFTRL